MLDCFLGAGPYFGAYCLNIGSLKNRDHGRDYSLGRIIFCRSHGNTISLFIELLLGTIIFQSEFA